MEEEEEEKGKGEGIAMVLVLLLFFDTANVLKEALSTLRVCNVCIL